MLALTAVYFPVFRAMHVLTRKEVMTVVTRCAALLHQHTLGMAVTWLQKMIRLANLVPANFSKKKKKIQD